MMNDSSTASTTSSPVLVSASTTSEKDEAITKLLELCKASNIDVDDKLRHALLSSSDHNNDHQQHPSSSSSSPPPIVTTTTATKSKRRTIMMADNARRTFSKRETILGALVRRRKLEQRDECSPEADIMREIGQTLRATGARKVPFEVRIKDGSYTVKTPVAATGEKMGQQFIPTVTNSRALIKMARAIWGVITSGSYQQKTETKSVLEGINLFLEGGKTYLVLGAPGSGKSSLLKMIANLLPEDGNHTVGGSIMVNGVDSRNKEIVWRNVVAYVDQIDMLHGFLTVKETIDFAFQCSYGGTHRGPFSSKEPDAENVLKEMDNKGWLVDIILKGVGLKRVADTFVGNNRVRGVSGGEKKRVTVGEMIATRTFVKCYDEISTGLDAVTTFDVCKLLCSVTRMRSTVTLISLLQPPPETVALFDDVIFLDNGRILFVGPVDEVTQHFKNLGYRQPERMDPADWLQSLPTKDGSKFLTVSNDGENFTSDELMKKYRESTRGQEMCKKLDTPVADGVAQLLCHSRFKKRYANSSYRSIKIVLARELLLWWRDKYAIKARLAQIIIMGLIVGTVFWQTDDPQSVMGVVFYSVLFIGLGTLARIAPQFETRGILYKEQDANFFPTWTFVLARALAGIPSSLQDSLIFGSLIYWLSGLAPSATSYFVFLLLLLVYAFSCSLMFSVYSAKIRDRSSAQAAMAITMATLILFSGFTVQPNVIPSYYIWIYWSNMLAWIIRAAVVNEYQSGFYDEVISKDGTTQGEAILERFGFTINGEPFQFVWVWYAVMFCAGLCFVSMMCSVWFLTNIRFTSSKSAAGNKDKCDEEPIEQDLMDSGSCSLEARGITLTFKNINYFVSASTTKDKLHLLKGITGYFAAGKMTALMGSSGAGKTTLMDVLSLRKASGEVSGDILVNGHPQEPNSFRRITGYVEQFDVQSPQLTIRETVEFSAKMRLDESIPLEAKTKYVDRVLATLELDTIAGFLVGDETGGLSFEQRKRLSIAVELASNPSCIFLDEPTSGLDTRAANIVMRCLRRIADSGIAVVATIHQPSVAIFNSFDTLLLLKRGGETVYFGDLGDESYTMINYFEGYPSTCQIKGGENPATWMLTTIGVGSANTDAEIFDYAKAYSGSSLAKDCIRMIELNNTMDDSHITFPTKYATCARTQSIEVFKRLGKIYHRSPGYNRVRLFVSAIIALLFGSVFASQRVPQNEGDMVSRVTSIFITIMFLNVNALNTSLPVFEMERNMFYRHKASMMYDHKAVTLAFTLVEAPFILLSSMVFCLLWYFTAGFALNAAKFFLYFLFMTFSLGVFTFFGQGLMAIFRDAQTAQGFGALLIGMSSIFGGILIRPQDIKSFWIWAYWTFPIHYIIEGLLTSQFRNDQTPIVASLSSPYYYYVLDKNCPNIPPDQTPPVECTTGTAEDWIYVSFGGMWVPEHIPYNILYLICAIIAAKAAALYGLKTKNYLAN